MDEFEVREGEQNLHAAITAVLDGEGQPTNLPGTPAWTSTNLDVAVPHPAQDGLSAKLDVVGPGETTIVVDTGISDTPTSLVQGRCRLTVKPYPGEVRRVVIELYTE